jgi:hypothetical protein
MLPIDPTDVELNVQKIKWFISEPFESSTGLFLVALPMALLGRYSS